MAKFKKKRKRSPFFARARRRSSSRSAGLNFKGLAVGGFAYGAIRGPVSNFVAPIARPLAGPLGNIADEVALAGAAWLIGTKIRSPLVRDITRAAFTVEMARIGEAVTTGQLGLGGSTGSSAGLLF